MASVWSELKRRNVVKVAVAYAIVGWILFQLTDVLISLLDLPGWIGRGVFLLVLIGFPLALIFAWAYELTPEGIKREKDVDRSESVTRQTGQKLNYGIVVLLALAVGFILVDKFVLDGESPQPDTSDKSIAVLPFNSDVNEEGAQSIADGIQTEVNTQLSRLGSLTVISGTAEYLNTLKSLREIGEELNVAFLVQGRLQRAGDHVQINVDLINTRTSEQIWSDSYVRELLVENRFAVQKEMALAIAGELQVNLTPEEAERLNDLPTESSLAYDYYLAGLSAEGRYDRSDRSVLAVQQYERAIAEDPTFALAFARMPIALFYRGILEGRGQDQDHRDEIRANAERALQLQPDLPEGHLAMAIHYYVNDEFDPALAELAIAEQGLPNESEIFKYRALILRRMQGRLDEALEAGKRMVELDPRQDKESLFHLGVTYLWARNFTEATAALDKLLVIKPDHERARIVRATTDLQAYGDPGSTNAFVASDVEMFLENGTDIDRPWLAAIYERNYDRALRYVDRWAEARRVGENASFLKASYYGQTLQLSDQPELAIAYFEEAQADFAQNLGNSAGNFRELIAQATVAAGLGNNEEAIKLAEQAMSTTPREGNVWDAARVQLDAVRSVFAVVRDEERVLQHLDDYLSNAGSWSIEGLLPDPRFDFIRDDSRFVALVEKYRRK